MKSAEPLMKNLSTQLRAAVCILMLIATAPAVFGAGPTLVSGNVSGTWSPTGSPYVIVDNCTVPAASTLTIQPGTVVIIGQGLNLTVNGCARRWEHGPKRAV